MTETKTNNKTPKMVLKLDEDNAVKFKLSIQGTVSDPSQTQTNVRFVVSENKSGMAFLFPLVRGDEENLFKTTIPMGNMFSETKEYTGRVEVIVGGRYFNPTTVNIAFERELRVEATPIMSEEQTHDPDSEDIFGVLKEEPKGRSAKPQSGLPMGVIFNTNKPQPVQQPPQQQEATVKKRQAAQVAPVASKPEKKSLVAIVEEKVPVNGRREKQKNKLKSLIAEAWDEMDR